MHHYQGLRKTFKPNWPELIRTILRKGTPSRAYNIELFQDVEIRNAIAQRFGLTANLDPNDSHFEQKKLIAVNRFCGFDCVNVGLLDLTMQLNWHPMEDTAELKRATGRRYMDEHVGPITNWEQFEKYPWPDPKSPAATRDLEWFQANLPDDMCIIGGGGAHFAEEVTWLMGYETLCYALFDNRELVQAIADKLLEHYRVVMARVLQFDRVKIVFASDDMGYKTGLMISPNDTRHFVLKGHKIMAEMAHATGRPYLLHACGKLTDIIPDLVHDVKIDAKHSYEDTIEDVRDVKHTYGKDIAMLGGMDVDFLCRNEPAAIRKRVRLTLDACQQGGGYCLGTGNTVANYIPLDNYLTMLDEGRLWS